MAGKQGQTQSSEEMLAILERKVLRRNCAPVHEKDLGWRLRQDAELCEPLDEPVIGKYTNIKRTQKYWINNPTEEDLGADTRRESSS